MNKINKKYSFKVPDGLSIPFLAISWKDSQWRNPLCLYVQDLKFLEGYFENRNTDKIFQKLENEPVWRTKNNFTSKSIKKTFLLPVASI